MTVRLLRLKPVAIFWASVGVGQQVAGDLFDQEAVERLVAVESGDDPVAPGPHGPGEVVLVAVGVGEPSAVEPVHRHPLAVERRREQAIDGCIESRRAGGEKRVDLRRQRRHSRQVEA